MTDDPRVAALVEAYRGADATMRDLPIYNRALTVEALGFRALDDSTLAGILIAPWFMNLVLLPLHAEPIVPARYGEGRTVALPAGERRFRYAGDTAIGAIWTAALHSPMDVFTSQAQARAEARLRIAEAMQPPSPARETLACPGRRAFFGGSAPAAS